MKKHAHFIFYFTLLSLLLFHTSQAQITNKRQLKLYKNAGTFDFGWSVTDAECRIKTSKLIDFLSSHLSEKKLGRAIMVMPFTIEGDTITSKFYVEPDKNGQWIIVEEWESVCCALFSLEKKKRKPIIKSGKTIYESMPGIEQALRENKMRFRF